jgi:hypothetical protein
MTKVNTLRRSKPLTNEVFGIGRPWKRRTKGPHLYIVMLVLRKFYPNSLSNPSATKAVKTAA